MELDESYQNIYTLRKILSNTEKTNLLQTKIKKLIKCKDNFLSEHDIKLLKTTKIPLNFKDNIKSYFFNSNFQLL